jgi:hypothetical protein
MSSSCPGHVWVSGFILYIRGLGTPSNPNLAKPLSLSLSCGSQGSPKAIWELLHQIPSVSREFDSPSPQDLQTLSGSISPKVFSRFSFDFFDLLLIFVNVRSRYLGAPLGCRNLALNLVQNQIPCFAYLKTRFQSLIFVIYSYIQQCKS